MQKIVVLGASRGLGRHVCEVLTQSVESELLLVARTEQSLISACESVKSPSCSPKHLKCDVADPAQQELLFKKIEEFNPHIILNFIGGGPYGAYPEKDWKDHRWAIEVSFLFSARLLHF